MFVYIFTYKHCIIISSTIFLEIPFKKNIKNNGKLLLQSMGQDTVQMYAILCLSQLMKLYQE